MIHIPYSIESIAQLLSGRLIEGTKNAFISTFAYDSRRIGDYKSVLFFALSGRRDGHQFIEEAYNLGVRNFVVKNESDYPDRFPEANFLIVPDVKKALQILASVHRQRFDYPVIAITGSNGKTITKEWLYQLLATKETIVRSPKSYNSQIGVPLSIWAMDERHSLGIFEAGISQPGEMKALQDVIRPTIGVLTNIGAAHDDGFISVQEKIAEKLLLFTGVELFIYNPLYLKDFKGEIPGKRQFTWGAKMNVDLQVVGCDVDPARTGCLIKAIYQDSSIQIKVPFTDAASIENAICCWATLLALDINPDFIALGMAKLQAMSMRLELKDGINNCSIIDDSYSLDLSSLAIALDFLKQQNQHQRKTLILSDVPSSGFQDKVLYAQVATLIKNKAVDKLIGVGAEITKYADLFEGEKMFFSDTPTLLAQLDSLNLENETILLKGARVFEFEKISKVLVKKVHETILEINLSALESNLNHYRSLLAPGVKITTMVKAFSYGSGSYEIANLLQFNKVDFLAVAIADEGVALRQAGISLPIMVLNPDVDGYDTMIQHNLEPQIYNLRVFNDFNEAVKKHNKEAYSIHIKLDTGMHRLGFTEIELPQLLQALQKDSVLKVTSAFSHLTSSEDAASDQYTDEQIAMFKRMTRSLEEVLGYSFIKHISNTSGISRRPDAQFDMVRLGIGLYGVDSIYAESPSPLRTVASLKTCISQIKPLHMGDTVGYNRKGVMAHEGKVATVKIGYADGYNRRFGNGVGKMIVNGVVVPTIGNICMDMCMLDITGVDAKEGDEVVVFNEQITVFDLARQIQTIPYEILTSISQRVKRVYLYE